MRGDLRRLWKIGKERRQRHSAKQKKVTGSIEKGKSADLLIVDGNPLEDFKNLSKPYMVVIKGKEIKNPKVKKYALNDNLLDKYM